MDASRFEGGQLLPESGQFEQNVSSVLTSTRHAVLVHIKTHLYFSFLYSIFFNVNAHCVSIFHVSLLN